TSALLNPVRFETSATKPPLFMALLPSRSSGVPHRNPPRRKGSNQSGEGFKYPAARYDGYA
ncbi:MAG: hypothetical protein WA635_05535, partial [Gallionella sp.]